MPTFNQLVRKGDRQIRKEVHSSGSAEGLQLLTEESYLMFPLLRREVSAQQLRLLPKKKPNSALRKDCQSSSF